MEIKNGSLLEIKQSETGQTQHETCFQRTPCVCVCMCAAPLIKYTQVTCCALWDVNEIMSIKAESLRT